MPSLLANSHPDLSHLHAESTPVPTGVTPFKRRLGIGCGLLYYLLLGLEETIISPFFSIEAEKRNLSTLETGIAFSVMEASGFLTSFFVMYFIKPKTQGLFCVVGIFITAISSSAVGVLQWVHSRTLFLCIAVCCEVVVGVGAAMSLATVIPIITSLSLKNAGKITSWAEALLSFGGLLGPPLGSVLYSYFGFCTPPLVSGGLLLVCGCLSLTFLSTNATPQETIATSSFFRNQASLSPSASSSSSTSSSNKAEEKCFGDTEQRQQLSPSDSKPNSDNVSRSDGSSSSFDPLAYIKFILKPNLLVVSSLGILVAAQMIFFDVCLPLYLKDVYGLNAIEIGMMFLTFALCNVGMVPVYGIAVDRGYAMHVTLLTSLGFSVTFAVLYLPKLFPDQLQNLYFISTCFSFAGFFSAGAFVPSYLVYEKLAEANGFSNIVQTKLMVATWCNNSFAVGALYGSIALSGPVFENYGFSTTCIILSMSMAVCIVLSVVCVYRMDLLTKMFYFEVLQQLDGGGTVDAAKQPPSRDSSLDLDLAATGTRHPDTEIGPESPAIRSRRRCLEENLIVNSIELEPSKDEIV